ncbi:protein phosphatase 1 regulatory subunit 15B [Thalassophryne amazonica]|uniref:protein phosphatase 1 regulatory subunit 15B n=1 Tax=Thalassophryne amazonica TaxID=390379 RepID=UPI0014720B28|nr:protein phosphatase 1 regulatory subunit 15B [Thalassophryne amazonica]
MAAVVRRDCDRVSMEAVDGGQTALLPWTKHMLTVLWERLWLLLQLIYYTFVSVFQMFRFEVHVRITDETGQHIQHMSTATNSTESFLFSSIFDGDAGVVVAGSNPLSDFCTDIGDPFSGKSTAEALLSSLQADDLCRELVDDFVSRTAGKEEDIFGGHHTTWKMGFPGDWNIVVSSTDGSSTNGRCQVFKKESFKEKLDTSEEDRSSPWSSEEDQSMEFESEETRALWESLSKCSDPYNLFFFSESISTNGNMKESKSDRMSVGTTEELHSWLSRSDSETSSSSWGSSENSWIDLDTEESNGLWESFTSCNDPYNPMNFTACTTTNRPPQSTATSSDCHTALSTSSSKSNTDTEENSSFTSSSSEDDEEDQAWKSLFQVDDPFHPLNFRASLKGSSAAQSKVDTGAPGVGYMQQWEEESVSPQRSTKPTLTERHLKHHSHPEKTILPWKRPDHMSPSPPEERQRENTTTMKKVRFSPVVHVHVLRTWLFARQASRKGHWEEMARDRERFKRRIQATEQAIGYCFSQSHRDKMWAFLDCALK